MALDPVTLLTLTIALATASACYLVAEWHSVRERSLLFWSAGFATVSIGSTLSLLRLHGYPVLGIWFANGLLVCAHGLFLLGVSRFTQRPLSRAWLLLAAVWGALLLLPEASWWSRIMLLVNSWLVGLLSIRGGLLLRRNRVGERQLRWVLLGHGLFYMAKGTTVLTPGTPLDLTAFRGQIIQISLVEGVIVIMLIALSVTGTVRYRREQHIERLAGSDPLTGLYNRRALLAQAPALLEQIDHDRPGALLLIDLDNFKLANDLHGHAAGDGLLVALSDLIRTALPKQALAARLGGDEFVMLLAATSNAEALRLGERLREQFNDLAARRLTTPEPVTLSIGAVLFNDTKASLTALLERGDLALYEAKRGGRDGLRVSVA